MKLIFIYIVLCSVHFFGLHYLFGSIAYDLIDFSFYGIVLLLVLGNFLINSKSYKFPKGQRIFVKPILFLFVALFFSSISSFIFHGQVPWRTILAMRYFSYFILYFIFLKLGLSKEFVLKIVIYGAIIYMIVFTIQLILYPIQIVPFSSDLTFDRGFLRIRLEGVGFLTLTAFYALNKVAMRVETIKNFILYFICFAYIFILGFRTLLLTFLFSSLTLVIYNRGVTKLKTIGTLASILIVLVVGWQFSIVRDFIFEGITRTESQIGQGNEYIRFLTFDFLFNKVNINFWSILFGNGMPVEGTNYGNYVLDYGADKRGFISADLGLIGFLFNYGLLSLFALLNIFRIGIFVNVSEDSVYIRYFFLYLIISSITTAEIFRAGMFGVEMIALYLITLSYSNSKTKFKLQNVETS